jgi:hypothetical protein
MLLGINYSSKSNDVNIVILLQEETTKVSLDQCSQPQQAGAIVVKLRPVVDDLTSYAI